MLPISEVTAPRKGRPPSFRSTGVPNVRHTGWGTYFGEVRVHGQRIYTGTFRSVREAAEAVAAIRRWRDRVQPEVPQPIVTSRPTAPIAEPAAYTWFGR